MPVEAFKKTHVSSDVHERQPYSSRDWNPAVVTDFVSP